MKQKRRERRKNFFLRVVVLVSVLIIGYGSVMTVQGMEESEKIRLKEAYDQERENRLQDSIRAYLDENGFRNSGIMITRVVFEDDSRKYTLVVHHKKIDKMNEKEKELLSGTLMSLCCGTEGGARSGFQQIEICFMKGDW